MVYSGLVHELGGKGHKKNVVFPLLCEKLNVGHAVSMENFYNSFELAKNLLDSKNHCPKTLRLYRKSNSKDVTQQILAEGVPIAKYRDGVLIGKCKDTRDVLNISTDTINDI